MRLNLLILLLTIVIGGALTWWLDQNTLPPPSTSPEVVDMPAAVQGVRVPDFSFTDTQGKKHDISDFRGKVVILNFWASWCAPCVIEFPKLAELAKQNPDIVIIALSGDTSMANIEKFLKKHPTGRKNFYVAHDKRREITTNIFQTFKLPESIIINAEGRMVRKILGDTDWLGPEMAGFLDNLQEKTPDSPLGSPVLKD